MSYDPPSGWAPPSGMPSTEERAWLGIGIAFLLVGSLIPGIAIENTAIYALTMWMVRDLQRYLGRGLSGGEVLMLFLFTTLALPGWALLRYRLVGALGVVGVALGSCAGWVTWWDPGP